MSLLERIETLYLWRGQQLSDSASGAPLTYLHHALQTAQLAEGDDAPEPLVAAAFLHDIGLLLPPRMRADGGDVPHLHRAVEFLREGFDDRVLEPVRLQGQAERYLAAAHRDRAPDLSGFRLPTLGRSGGPMSTHEMLRFSAHPYAADAVQVRRWARCARLHVHPTPPLAWYLGLLEAVLERPMPWPLDASAAYPRATPALEH
jgi:predicted HD phosphohydrolase